MRLILPVLFFVGLPFFVQADEPPAPLREFRAAWVATVANIDWPSRSDLSVAEQQREMTTILDRAQELKLNAIVFQVRTAADALYDSKIEPWSEFLTGEQGKAPSPYYDPLVMWIDGAHSRGMELHAWFNPYRARHTAAKSPNASNHVAKTMPGAVKEYGGFLWMDPAESAASDQTLRVMLDVVERYDVDGIHIDDYFYPYPVNQPDTQPPVEAPFPDEPAWQSYLATKPSNVLSRDDWRRRNVDQLIAKIYEGIKSKKKHVKFGISPFGIGKPTKRPNGIVGFSQYDKLYADAELWLEKGWLDYWTPQLYWPIDQAPQAFGVLLDYWAAENPSKRHIWPGLYTSRINNSDNSWTTSEIANQIQMTRDRGVSNPFTLGHVHFSMKALLENRKGLNDVLKSGLYSQPALIPACPWLDPVPPQAPNFDWKSSTSRSTLIPSKPVDSDVVKFGVWAKMKSGWKMHVLVADEATFQHGFVWEGEDLPTEVRLFAVDRVGNVSK